MRKMKGFTLVELLIVVAIVAIIAAIAYPSFSGQAYKSRRSDAYAALQQAAALQERWFAQQRSYSANADPFNGTANTTSPEGYYSISVALAGSGYTLHATPVAGLVQAGDDKCTRISLAHTGKKSSTGTRATELDCWR